MSFFFNCPWCDQKIECEDTDHNSSAACPACGKTMLVRDKSRVDDIKLPPPLSAKKKVDHESFFDVGSKTILTFKCRECGQMIKQMVSSTGTVLQCPACHSRFSVKPEDAVPEDTVPEDTAHKEQMYVTPRAKKELEEPLLTTLFYILGCLHGICAVVSLVILIVKIDRNENIFLSACGIAASVTCMLISFGLSEFFKLISEISQNSKRTSDTLYALREMFEEKK